MRKARFTRHQFIAVLKSVEAERTVKDVCRETGKLTQNGFIERFNRTYRTEILNFYLFRT